MYVRVGALMVALLLGGCAGGPPKQGPESLDLKETPSRPGATSTASDGRDPFQGANRAMWVVNYDVLEPYVARPVVHGYARYIPKGMKDGIENLVENFNEPSSMVNHLITGDLKGRAPTWVASPSTPQWVCWVSSTWPSMPALRATSWSSIPCWAAPISAMAPT